MDKEILSRILNESIEKSKNDMIKNLCNMIEIASVSYSEEVKDALSFVLHLGEKMGFSCKALVNGKVGVIEIGEGEENLGILSHIDVVDEGDLAKWKTPPFKGVVLDEKIYGRGALDNKGPIVAALYAMKAVKELNVPIFKKISLIIGTQEEVEWSDMREYTRLYPVPDYGFTPDDIFPICNIEKGSIEIEISFSILEVRQEGSYITNITSGTGMNVVPDTCVAKIAKIEKDMNEKLQVISEEILETSGIAVHSCQPEKGENAILKMMTKLESYNFVENATLNLVKMINDKFSDVTGEKLGICQSTEFFNGEFVHNTTVIPTMIKQDGEKMKISINIRFPYGIDEQEIKEKIYLVALDYGGEVTVYESYPAVYVSKEKKFMKAFAESYERVTGEEEQFVLAYGGSYAKAMKNIVAWGPVFPGEEDTCHEENEYIKIESLMKNCKIFAQAISRIALCEESFK